MLGQVLQYDFELLAEYLWMVGNKILDLKAYVELVNMVLGFDNVFVRDSFCIFNALYSLLELVFGVNLPRSN